MWYLRGDHYGIKVLIQNEWGLFSLQKEFKTLDEQISLLKNRGLIIPDENRAKRYLLTNNYYNIINGYGKYFQNIPDHYIEDTSFNEVSRLYFFEEEIKKSIFNAALQIEHHMKSIAAYRFAEEYKDKEYAYLNPTSYNERKLSDASITISKFSNILKRKVNKPGSPIHHYAAAYQRVPIWVIIEYLDFGGIYYFIKELPNQILNKIAADLNPFFMENNNGIYPGHSLTPAIMLSYMKNILEIRNVCAHNKRLIEFNCHEDAKYFSLLHDQYNIGSRDQRRNFYNTFIVMQCFLSKTEFGILNNTLRKQFKNLNNHLNTISINDIFDKMGFPRD